MSNLNPNNDWLKDLQESLWQIKMVNKASGFMVDGIFAAVSWLQKWRLSIQAATTALTRFSTILNSRAIQRGARDTLHNASVRLSQWGTHLQGRGGFVSRQVGGMLRGASRRLGSLSGFAGNLSTTGLLGIGGGAAVANMAWKVWSQHHQEMLENARKQATARSGRQARSAQLDTKLQGELEKERIRDIYAIEQKRAENAKALHLMKATNVASELKYQREIFAIEERRFENEKKIAALKTRANQITERTNLVFQELEKVGSARDSAHIVRRWWWADKTVDANGNKIDNNLARAAGLRTLRARSTVDANFAALQSIAANVRASIIAGFREGSDIMATKLSSVLDKLSALGADAYSDELRAEFNRLQVRIADVQQRRATSMYAISYDKMMRMSEEEAKRAGLLSEDKDGNYVFTDADGDARTISKGKFRKKKREHLENNRNGYAPVVAFEQAEAQANADLDEFSVRAEMAGHVQGVATERIKKELERRKEISEKFRESLVSGISEGIGQYADPGLVTQQKLLARTRNLYQEYVLAGVQDDAEATQEMKQDFAMNNAVQDAQDKAAEKAENEKRELVTKNMLESARIQMRAVDRQTQASIAFKEAQAELSRKINMLQLDVELANADTYGKTVWETQKTINHANIDWKHQTNLEQINEAHRQREVAEEKRLDTAKWDALYQLEMDQIKEREKLEKDLIDARMNYEIAEIDYTQKYKARLEEEYEKRRENKRKAWLQGVTKEEVKSLIGVDKEVSELTMDEQDRLAQTRKAQAERADDLEGIEKEFGVSGQSQEEFSKTLDEQISRYAAVRSSIGDVRRAVDEKRMKESARIEEKQKNSILTEMAAEGLIDNQKLYNLRQNGLEADAIARHFDKKMQEEYNTRLTYHKPEWEVDRAKEVETYVNKFLDEKYGENRDLIKYDAETGNVSVDDIKGNRAQKTKDMLQWQTDHSEELRQAKANAEKEDEDMAAELEQIRERARKDSGLDDAIAKRNKVDMQALEDRARQTAAKEELEHEFERRGKEEESQRKIDKENDIANEEYRNKKVTGYSDIGLSHAAKYDRFAAEQADIYNRGQITQQNLATDTLVSAMRQGGGGYTNTMIKYGIQSEYEAVKNDMEARHKAEQEQLESRGNVTEYERQQLKNQQAMEASGLENDKKLRDMMADRIMNESVGQKSGLAETWERIQASAFGHMKDPVEMAIDSLKENDSKNHDDLMSRLDQYLPAIAQNTAETDAAAVNQYNSYFRQEAQINQGLQAGMPNVRTM